MNSSLSISPDCKSFHCGAAGVYLCGDHQVSCVCQAAGMPSSKTQPLPSGACASGHTGLRAGPRAACRAAVTAPKDTRTASHSCPLCPLSPDIVGLQEDLSLILCHGLNSTDQAQVLGQPGCKVSANLCVALPAQVNVPHRNTISLVIHNLMLNLRHC